MKPVISSVRFLRAFRCFAKGDQLVLREGVNLLVGDQGVGKTTILDLLMSLGTKGDPQRTSEIISREGTRGRIVKFDFERDNPRIQATLGENVLAQLSAMRSSHGETTRALIESVPTPAPPALFLLDGPDMSLSPRSIPILIAKLRQLGERYQVLAAVHHPWVIEAFSEVLDLARREWVRSREYLSAARRAANAEVER